MRSFHAVAIAICDNDFENTFRPLLETVQRAVAFNDGMMNREEVRQLILDGIEFHYLLFQCGGDLGRRRYVRGIVEMVRDKILFDEESQAHYENMRHKGYGSWVLDVTTGKVWGY